jgi:hypothetical protein
MVLGVGVKFNDAVLRDKILNVTVSFFENLVTNLEELVSFSYVNVEGHTTCGSLCGGSVYHSYISKVKISSPSYAFVATLSSAIHGSKRSDISFAGSEKNLIRTGVIRALGPYMKSWWQGHVQFDAETKEFSKVVWAEQDFHYEPYCIIEPYCIGNAVGLALSIPLIL